MTFFEGFWAFISSHTQDLLGQTLQHIKLTLVALGIAVGIGLAAGILLSRRPRLAGPVLGFVNVIQTIPSLALLGLLLPLVGIGQVPAIIALFLYALLPIVRNTYAGITEVDPAITEAARGMGLTGTQVLLKVQLPLALPVIFAGIRTAVVINVGVATLCALIAAGGLGEFIFRGIALNNVYMIAAGALPAALLALFFDFVLGLLQRHILQVWRPLVAVAGLAVVLGLGWQLLAGSGTNSGQPLRAGLPSEFIERGDGWQGLKAHYDFTMPTVELEIGLMYQALYNGNVDVISGFSTDGRIEAYNLLSLQDDKQYFPPYDAAPVIRQDVLQQYPELQQAFSWLQGRITDAAMVKMNFRADHDKVDVDQVARDFLAQQGLTLVPPRSGPAQIVIGSKNFTESFILAEMFKALIEAKTGLTVQNKLGFGGTQLVFEALKNGQISLYPEYTGTGYLVILKARQNNPEAQINNKQELYQYVKKAFEQQYELTWGPPLGFNNTFALMMRQAHADSLSIGSISQLTQYLKQNQPAP